MNVSVHVRLEKNEVLASCPELGINCYGSSRLEAIDRMKSVISFYLISAREMGLEVEHLEGLSVDGRITPLMDLHNRPVTPSTDTVN